MSGKEGGGPNSVRSCEFCAAYQANQCAFHTHAPARCCPLKQIRGQIRVYPNAQRVKYVRLIRPSFCFNISLFHWRSSPSLLSTSALRKDWLSTPDGFCYIKAVRALELPVCPRLTGKAGEERLHAAALHLRHFGLKHQERGFEEPVRKLRDDNGEQQCADV